MLHQIYSWLPFTILKFMNCINAFLDSYFPGECKQLKNSQEMRGRTEGEVRVFISSYFLIRLPKIGCVALPKGDCSCNNNFSFWSQKSPACKWLHVASPHCFCPLLMHIDFLCRWEVNICITPLRGGCMLLQLICKNSLLV